MNKPSLNRKQLIGLAVFAVCIVMLVAPITERMRTALAAYPSSLTELWPFNAPLMEHSYIIGQYDSTNYYLKNCSNGKYDLTSTNISLVVNTALSNGGTVILSAGNYITSSGFRIVSSYTNLLCEIGVSITYTGATDFLIVGGQATTVTQVTIQSLKVLGNGIGTGIKISRANYVKILDCSLTWFEKGIQITDAFEGANHIGYCYNIERNILTNFTLDAISTEQYLSAFRIRDNSIEYCRYGIAFLNDTIDADITGNTVQAVKTGIYAAPITHADGFNMDGNTLFWCWDCGIDLVYYAYGFSINSGHINSYSNGSYGIKTATYCYGTINGIYIEGTNIYDIYVSSGWSNVKITGAVCEGIVSLPATIMGTFFDTERYGQYYTINGTTEFTINLPGMSAGLKTVIAMPQWDTTVWITLPNSTAFTVHFGTGPVGDKYTFWWAGS